MKRKRISLVGLAFAMLLLLVLLFFLRLSIHRPREVVLPETTGVGTGQDPENGPRQESIRRVEVRPETVQRVIERMERPRRYSRTVVIERYWSGGSGMTTASVRSAEGWTRMDITDRDERTRHVITGDGKSWIWYDGDAVYAGASLLTEDEEQGIPTYETVLTQPVERIAAADYRMLDATDCIYVESLPDEAGYVDAWWISLKTGLLAAAQRSRNGTVVYRMAEQNVQLDAGMSQAFTLPGGQVLYEPEA